MSDTKRARGITGRFVAVALAGATLLGACSSGGSDDEASKASDTTTTTEAVATSDTNDSASLCEQFQGLAAQREQQGGGGVQPGSAEAAPDGEEGWARRIETTQALADAAPADSQDEGATYVELVKARAELFAAHGYPASTAEIPAADVQAFINDHKDEQQIANQFIAFAKGECGVS